MKLKKTKKNLTEEIHDWIVDLNYWEQFLAFKILYKEAITENDVKLAYKYFLEDNELIKKKTSRKKISIISTSSNSDVSTDFFLSEIKNVKGVNALKEDQNIPVSKKLTIIYGDNGVGKSGYIRILNNTFLSRGDKSLLENIYSKVKPKETSCVFKFTNSLRDYELKFPDDIGKYEFNCYSVFDSTSITAHLKKENLIQFLPNGLDFFDSFSSIITKVQKLFEDDIEKNTLRNDFVDFFDHDTSVRKLVLGLNSSTDIKTFQEKSKSSPEEVSKLSSLEKKLNKLQKIDVTKKVKSLTKIKDQLKVLRNDIENINDYFSYESIKEYKKLISHFILNKKLSISEGLAQFETEKIGSIGSDEWKDLIVAAKSFAEIQYEEKDLYPVNNDFCLLCNQTLSKEAKLLIESYWKYLISNAENDLNEITDKIDEIRAELEELDLIIFDEDSILYEWLEENEVNTLRIWSKQIKSAEFLRKQLLACLKRQKWNDEIKENKISTKEFTTIEKSIQIKLLGFNEVEINRIINSVEKDIQELKDKKKLATLTTKIVDYINKLKWAAKANTKRFNTRKITEQQKDLYSKFVTDEYIKIFNQECERLDAKFGIKISQRAQKGTTLKQLALEGWTPSQILSEGEQHAISLADFLTEAQMGFKNKGIIIDDPVNSLDHIRRQTIAERLVKESEVRQVIVFTHDITFLLALQTLAEEGKVDCFVTTIRKIGNTPGVISNSLPWIASNVKERVKKLNEALPYLKKWESGTDPDYYNEEAKKWCGLLRETWERSIEELLFNDAIQRFSPGIQTKRIEKMKFTPELYKEIEIGMSECSNWVHDQARAINNPTPKVIKLESYLESFKEFVKKFR